MAPAAAAAALLAVVSPCAPARAAAPAAAPAPAPIPASGPTPRVLYAAPRGDVPVRIDGHLNEPAWAAAPVGGDFIEREPTPRAKPPVATEVRVLYDAGALYVGVTCFLEPGERPRALELTRDSYGIWADDAVTLKFDVRRDRRTTVGFATNAAGAQLDYVSVDNGRDERREFDAVWEAATSADERAWYLEVRLPAAALGLGPGGDDRVIGFQVSRDHNKRVATYDWSWMPPEFGPVAAPFYGELRGVKDIGGGRPLAAIPYALARVEGEPGRGVGGGAPRAAFKAGGDLRMRIGPDAWAELTVLTDFAQVDLDDAVVNLDRFPLFLPEKRPFFLSGLDLFDFGTLGAAQLFFSRRIGLDAGGGEVPILAGLKSYGRVGTVGYGLLDVLTAATDTDAAANFAVARVRREVDDSSYVGAMIAMKDEIGAPAALQRGGHPLVSHYAVGVDGATRMLDERLELRAWSATTTTESAAGAADGVAAGASVAWHSDAFRPRLYLLYVSDGFDPAVGFVRRAGYFEEDARAAWIQRTRRLGLDALELVVGARTGFSDELDRRLSVEYYAGVEWGWLAGWRLEGYGTYREEVVEADFELVPGVVVPAGTYRGGEVWFHFGTPERRSPLLYADYTAGQFFGGYIHNVSAEGVAAFGRHVRLTIGTSWSRILLGAYAPFSTLSLNGRLTVNPTTRVSGEAIVLVNTVDEAVTTLVRLRWRFLPGSDAFLVLRHDLAVNFSGTGSGGAGAGGDLARTTGYSVTLKVAVRFDLVL